MKIFITGASGYVGGSVAAHLQACGHHIVGLVRNPAKAEQLRERGIEPLLGHLDDAAVLTQGAQMCDAVINAAESDHIYGVRFLLNALRGTGKTFINTSGSSVVADLACGEPSDRVFHEDTPFEPIIEKTLRLAHNKAICSATQMGVRSIVLCPPLIYGVGRGLNPNSIQVPWMLELAKERRAGTHIGRGLNIWSTVHIDDVVEAYALALEKAPGGAFYYLENGESSFRDMAISLGRAWGWGEMTQTITIGEAVQRWGNETAYCAFGSNSRICADKARVELGWQPRHTSVLEEIENGCYRPSG